MSDGVKSRMFRILARIIDASARERIAISVAAFFASLLVGVGIILVAGIAATCTASSAYLPMGGLSACYNPVAVLWYLFGAPFLSGFNIALIGKETTLLLFTGLAVAVSFRAGLFNIGVQGQMVLGAFVSAVSVVYLAPLLPAGVFSGVVLILLAVIAGAVAGGLFGAIPGVLKAYADANEVITTIMLNFIASNLVFFLVGTRYFQDPTSQSPETKAVPAYAELNPILPLFGGSNFALFVFLSAVGMILLTFFILQYTSFGYDLRVSGLQPRAADYAGVDSKRMIVSSITLSGILAGVGGSVYVLMVLGRYRHGMPPLGFDGITVSILGGNNPLGVLPAAFLFGLMKAGSQLVRIQLDVPNQIVGVLQGLVILFVAMPEFFRMIGIRLNLLEDERERLKQVDDVSDDEPATEPEEDQ